MPVNPLRRAGNGKEKRLAAPGRRKSAYYSGGFFIRQVQKL
jgi:hypothetical protein